MSSWKSLIVVVSVVGCFASSSVLAFPGADHQWQAPDSTQSRSPCPGLNTVANHGFIARSGRNMSIPHIVQTMEDVFSLITWQSEFIFGAFMPFLEAGNHVGMNEDGDLTLLSLDALYNYPFLHDACFVHPDPGIVGSPYNPTSLELWEEMKTYSTDGEVFTLEDMLTYQIARAKHSLDNNPNTSLEILTSEPVRGFLGGEKIFMLLAGGHDTMEEFSLAAAEEFLIHNRLPEGYLPRQARNLTVVNAHDDFAKPIFDYFFEGMATGLLEAVEEEEGLEPTPLDTEANQDAGTNEETEPTAEELEEGEVGSNQQTESNAGEEGEVVADVLQSAGANSMSMFLLPLFFASAWWML